MRDCDDTYIFEVDDVPYHATFHYHDPITTCVLIQLPERMIFAGATIRNNTDVHNKKEAYKNALRRAVASKFLLNEVVPYSHKDNVTSYVSHFTSKIAMDYWNKFSHIFRTAYKLKEEIIKDDRHA